MSESVVDLESRAREPIHISGAIHLQGVMFMLSGTTCRLAGGRELRSDPGVTAERARRA